MFTYPGCYLSLLLDSKGSPYLNNSLKDFYALYHLDNKTVIMGFAKNILELSQMSKFKKLCIKTY